MSLVPILMVQIIQQRNRCYRGIDVRTGDQKVVSRGTGNTKARLQGQESGPGQ